MPTQRKAKTMKIISNNANETITRTIFEVAAGVFEVTCWHGGRVELYQRDSDGLMDFLGYLDAVQHHIPSTIWRQIVPGLSAHNKAHKAYWGAYLPGADKWLHAA